MASAKSIGILTLAAIVLAAAVGGGTYVTLTLRERALQRDFQLVSSLIQQKEFDRAAEVLNARLDKGRGRESWYPRALLLKLDLLEAKGDSAGAREVAQTILDPNRRYKGNAVLRAHVFMGMDALDEAQDADKAKAHFQVILDGKGDDNFGKDLARLGMIRIQLASSGPSAEIHDELEALRKDFPDSPALKDVEHVLGQVNVGLLYSPVTVGKDQVYELAKGDTIDGLARKFKMPRDVIMRVNGITDPKRLSIGRRLKIPDVDFSILVSKTENTLTLLNHGEFFKRYRVRTGKVDYLTPIGEFKVINKKIDPVWNDPKTGKTYGPGDPENELGSRWIGFQGASLGIHGTIRPETIGTYASNGCVGMLKDDIEELFDLVREGTPIKIVGKIQDPDKERAKDQKKRS